MAQWEKYAVMFCLGPRVWALGSWVHSALKWAWSLKSRWRQPCLPEFAERGTCHSSLRGSQPCGSVFRPPTDVMEKGGPAHSDHSASAAFALWPSGRSVALKNLWIAFRIIFHCLEQYLWLFIKRANKSPSQMVVWLCPRMSLWIGILFFSLWAGLPAVRPTTLNVTDLILLWTRRMFSEFLCSVPFYVCGMWMHMRVHMYMSICGG